MVPWVWGRLPGILREVREIYADDRVAKVSDAVAEPGESIMGNMTNVLQLSDSESTSKSGCAWIS